MLGRFVCVLAVTVVHAFGTFAVSQNDHDAPAILREDHNAEIKRLWGYFSPYTPRRSLIPGVTPQRCQITYAETLSRHGSRFPSASAGAKLRAVIKKIQTRPAHLVGPYQFLRRYHYALGADAITAYGEREMQDAGAYFCHTYCRRMACPVFPQLHALHVDRIMESAHSFAQGFRRACPATGKEAPLTTAPKPAPLKWPKDADETWQSKWLPPVVERVNKDLGGGDLLGPEEVLGLMDMCPFSTAASASGRVSLFCKLFTTDEWRQYSHAHSVGKFYRHGRFASIAEATDYVAELAARLEGKPGQPRLRAEFTSMAFLVNVLRLLHVFQGVPGPSLTALTTPGNGEAFSASRDIPFASRLYVERLDCGDARGPYVRVLLNQAVLPLPFCGSDVWGRCSLKRFLKELRPRVDTKKVMEDRMMGRVRSSVHK